MYTIAKSSAVSASHIVDGLPPVHPCGRLLRRHLKSLPKIFVTGTSGFLGSHFLCWAQDIGRPNAIVLIRGSDPATRKEKLIRTLTTALRSYETWSFDVLPKLVIVGGDVDQLCCGLAEGQIAKLAAAGVDEFWHFAASLQFAASERETTFARNVRGAENAVRLAAALGAERFIYVSTSYSVGAVEGLAHEALHDLSRPFCNPYEESKCSAEHAVVKLAADYDLAVTIFRPSIVIGPGTTKRTGGSRSGLYGLLSGLARSRNLLRKYASIQMPCRPEIELNLIPVDCVMRDIKEIVANDFGQNTIYHLCAARGPSVSDTLCAIWTQLNIDNVKLVPLSDPPSPIVNMMPQGIQSFYPYVRLDRRFVRSYSHDWALSSQELALFVARAHCETVSSAKEELNQPAGDLEVTTT